MKNFSVFKKFGFISFLVIAVFMLLGCANVFAKDNATKNHKSAAEILSDINMYQSQYFKIIKRHNVLLNYENDKNLNRDKKELKKLYKNVQKHISNKTYMDKYKDIEKRFAECNDVTTYGMNEFAYSHYGEVDELLTEVYEAVEAKISTEDFEKLYLSQKQWQKNVQNYKKVFDSMKLGSIGTIVYYDYEINMINFRTLLLMLYL